MKITIPYVPMTNNAYARSHWAVQRGEVKKWRLRLRYCAGAPVRRNVGRAWVSITVYRARLQDPDNAVASAKSIIDSLKQNGWLVDDSSDWLELEVHEVKAKRKDQRTEIEIRYEPLAVQGRRK